MLLRDGDRTALTLDGPVVLTVGNAASAILEVGGRTFADLGAPGQVVHLEVTHDGVRRIGGAGATGG